MMMSSIRQQFPQLQEKIAGKRFCYLDSGASTLKLASVMGKVNEVYAKFSSNVHRGAHFFSDRCTEMFESSRMQVAQFIGANRAEEVVFTRGTTESINLLAHVLGESLNEGDEILLSVMEHHSNLVPWQILAKKKRLKLRYIALNDQGELDMESYSNQLNEKTKIVSVSYVSNALGTVNPVKEIIKKAKQQSCYVILDAAQAVSSLPVDVKDLNCDFLAFSGHKLFAPTGVGVLWGRYELLEQLPPYQGGGSMISQVTLEGSDFLPPPQRFEAGTPHIVGAIGLGESTRFLQDVNMTKVHEFEKNLQQQLAERAVELGDIKVYSRSESNINVFSFLIEGIHPSDVGALLNQQGVAVRSGHHCCQPLMDFYNIPGTVRASLSIYTNEEDIDQFIAALKKTKEMLL